MLEHTRSARISDLRSQLTAHGRGIPPPATPTRRPRTATIRDPMPTTPRHPFGPANYERTMLCVNGSPPGLDPLLAHQRAARYVIVDEPSVGAVPDLTDLQGWNDSLQPVKLKTAR